MKKVSDYVLAITFFHDEIALTGVSGSLLGVEA
jgi:hypothetical protein